MMTEGEFKIRKRIGSGAFGEVYLVEDSKGESYALKQIPIPKTTKTAYLRAYFDG